MPGAGKKRATAQKKGQSGQAGAADKPGPVSGSAPGPSLPPAAEPVVSSFDGADDPPKPQQRLTAQPADSPLFSGGRALELGASAWSYLDSVSVKSFLDHG